MKYSGTIKYQKNTETKYNNKLKEFISYNIFKQYEGLNKFIEYMNENKVDIMSHIKDSDSLKQNIITLIIQYKIIMDPIISKLNSIIFNANQIRQYIEIYVIFKYLSEHIDTINTTGIATIIDLLRAEEARIAEEAIRAQEEKRQTASATIIQSKIRQRLAKKLLFKKEE
tara:strand:- start:1339 stop:1848 length:510 start_codon:yes stop_codon:yes gene_type:complete